ATRVAVVSGPAATTIDVRVDFPIAITNFIVPQPLLTLTAAGETQTVRTLARFSDGTSFDAAIGLGTTFTTSDANIVTVDSNGVLTAVGAGTATITVKNGDVT